MSWKRKEKSILLPVRNINYFRLIYKVKRAENKVMNLGCLDVACESRDERRTKIYERSE